MLLIIDADPIVYRCGFASEEAHYQVVAEDKDGGLHEACFRPVGETKRRRTAGEQLKEWLEVNDLTVVDKERIAVPEPLNFCLHTVKLQIEHIITAVKAHTKSKRLEVKLLLSGSDNFRKDVATIRPYKGNRNPAHKPYHYKAIRDYLCDNWQAHVVEGREADDECSILAWAAKGNVIVATIDKDLDQIPGEHYDYRQCVFYDVTEREADKFFWQQVLSGDSTDNIPGCYKVGVTKASNMVAVMEKDLDMMPGKCWEYVVAAYEESKTKSGCPYHDKPAEKVALETARLVYMQRRPRELWNPPGQEHETLEGADLDD